MESSSSGKSITTSVPTISIKFHANHEQLEEFYGSDDERKSVSIDDKILSVSDKEKGSSSTGNIQETIEASSLLGGVGSSLNKRSNSTEVSTVSSTGGDSSPPPSDPWKFFSEIKGKIAKNLEEKMSKKKTTLPPEETRKNTSDSEDLSESSISRTAGVTSTTEEGAEMSSDDDEESTTSKNETSSMNMFIPQTPALPVTPTFRQRFRLLKPKSNTEDVSKSSVFYDNEAPGQLNPSEEIESGVDALLETTPAGGDSSVEKPTEEDDRETEEDNVQTTKGFFDYRMEIAKEENNRNDYLYTLIIIVATSLVYLFIQNYSSYVAGIIAGVFITNFSYHFRNKFLPTRSKPVTVPISRQNVEFCGVPPIKEHQPVVKYEGWMNEYPDNYDPNTYHISLTQPVHLKLEGSCLKIGNTKNKVPKRATWNENIKKNITHRRVYNLSGAKVTLLPAGLTKVRQWSKKYPIYIALSTKFDVETSSNPSNVSGYSFRKKTSSSISLPPQRFSKLYAEHDNFYTDLEFPDTDDCDKSEVDEESWSLSDASPSETKIYLFARTDREKESWYRRFSLASRRDTASPESSNSNETLNESDYASYMTKHMNVTEQPSWLNALLGRFLFDFLCDEEFTVKIKERIRRKLAAIHLPYFIEELSITELNLGKTSPVFKKVSKPHLDERGLWIDIGVTYEGLVVLTLTTKLNLMKLKQPIAQENSEFENNQRSAIFHSDIDDSAESSSDDESPCVLPENGGVLTPPINKSKKLMKMVDKIAESKFFQAATDNKYIKRAMEGVSNTELRLKVEIRALEGTLVLNIPPAPSDRVWVGFRPVPELLLSAHPIVGERNITFMMVTGLIEKKLTQEFQKLLVVPNMEDLYIPFMMSKLPA